MASPTLCVGPSGWDYPHWDSVVYPRCRPRGFHPLSFLAQRFDTVEIESTFWRPARPEIARLWLAKVSHNPAFVFTALMGRRFTHERAIEPKEVSTFKEGLLPLLRAGRFGCLIMQFPWAFRFTEENRDYLIRLRRAFHDFPLAVEMRHASWLADEALGTLIDYRLGFANLDQPARTRATPPSALVTSPVGYARLHGRAESYWTQEFNGSAAPRPNDYLYPLSELHEWKARIDHISAHAGKTFVTFTNDAAGKSVINALQMANLLARRLARPCARYWVAA
jgi:uncharacterized protein YecE (DUF72 family)